MKKKIIIIIIACVAAIAAAAGFFIAKNIAPQKVVGELKVISYMPQGDEIPISTDGITVMFNKPVVPLTTLDSGRSKAVTLNITPPMNGKFFWLGTHGFIFRPDTAFQPATKYKIEMPAGLLSVDGYRLDSPLAWEFTTVVPRVLTSESKKSQMLLPKDAGIFLRFNVAMNKKDVQDKINLTDAASNQPIKENYEYIWGDDGHTLTLRFKEPLPWDAAFNLKLPKGILADKGDIGTASEFVVDYTTPPEEIVVDKVMATDYEEAISCEGESCNAGEKIITPNTKEAVNAGSGICYLFSQPINKKSFERALHVELADAAKIEKKKPQPYFYFQLWENFPTLKDNGQVKYIEGYKQGCVSFLDEHGQIYEFSIDPTKIESPSGAKLKTGSEKYAIETKHAKPKINSLLTKNIISLNGIMKIPYRAINISAVTIRLYKWKDKSEYSEEIKNTVLEADKMGLPIDAATMTIDQARMPADTTYEMPLDAKQDVSTRFMIDLLDLPQKPAAGIYILEAIGTPSVKANGKNQRTAVYSMIQITPIGIAIKREVDRVLVWTTDIESGSPLEGIPVRVSGEWWGEDAKTPQKISANEMTTNNQGIAVFNIQSDPTARFCAEVTLAGRESYSCEDQHFINSANSLTPRTHFYAYIYTDRPIYKPGQKVFFSSFIREVNEGRYFMPRENTKVALNVVDAAGASIFTQNAATIEAGGVVSGSLELPDSENIPRGTYTITMTIEGKQRMNKAFIVSSYRKPSFKVEAKAEKQEIISGDPLKVDVTGSYFFGAPLKNMAAKWSIMTSTHVFSPENFGDYSFIDEDLLYKKQNNEEEGEPEYTSEFEYDIVANSSETQYAEDQEQYDDPRSQSRNVYSNGFFRDPEKKDTSLVPVKLDDNGKLTITYTPDLKKYTTSQELSVEASVTDPSHQEVSGSEDIIVHKAAFYIGIKPEKWVYGEKEKAKMQLVSLDTQGKPSSGKSFAVDVVRREYKYIERRNAQGYWDILFEPSDKKFTTLEGKTDSNGTASVTYALPQGGEYRFVAKGKDSKGNEIQAATTIFAWGSDYVPWRVDKPEKIELVADKDSYKVGDTAKILVKSLVPVTKALLTLERGRVLEYRVIDLGSNAQHIELPITDGMIPNLYVSVVAHVGRNQDHPPLLYSGAVELHVEPEQKTLNIALSTDRKGDNDNLPIYRPGDEVKVSIKTTDIKGSPKKAHVMVSVADESVLKLLNYQLPNLIKKFYYQRPNSVATSSSLISLKAGDAGKAAGKRRRVFKDTAYFAANIETDDKGEASFSFKLPDDMTTWVIEVLGITESKSAKKFETEQLKHASQIPDGQKAMGADLTLTDGTFVGSARAKFMTTLPLVLRTAIPRFAAWGDELTARVIANNRTDKPAEGTMTISVSGDGIIKGDKNTEEIGFSIPAKSEKSFPVDITVHSANGNLGIIADAKTTLGDVLDSIEIGIPVLDRYAPEKVASSGMTKTKEQESIDLPKDTLGDKGGLFVSARASLALAAAPSLRNLIYFPWGCSEQKSATLMAMLMARDMTGRFGEKYFDALAPFTNEKIKATDGLEAKKTMLDKEIGDIVKELVAKFQSYDGGMLYWPESRYSDFYASAQTLVAFTMAKQHGVVLDEPIKKLKDFVRSKLNLKTKDGKFVFSSDGRAFAFFALTFDGSKETFVPSEWDAKIDDMSPPGLSYLLMAIKNSGSGADVLPAKNRLLSLAKQEARFISWPSSNFFWSSEAKNTALAALAFLTLDSNDTNVPRALDFLLNRKKVAPCPCTQDALYISLLTTMYSKVAKEEITSFTATMTVDKKELLKKYFSNENLTFVESASMPMKEMADLSMPAVITMEKQGEGTLYYDMELKYYLPPDKAPTREEGIIISREYYALDDADEKAPLINFKVGENYKGHITIVVPQAMNYILVQDLLPAGFEPIDMQLAISSQAARLAAREEDSGGRAEWEDSPKYDDVIRKTDYGMNFGFKHQEVRDAAIVWSDELVPPGVYHIRYPVRATTAGKFLMPGATAFEFYRPEIFGRSRTRIIEIKE